MIIQFEYDWSTYGLSIKLYLGVGLIRVSQNVWIDSWIKAPPEQRNEPKYIACSVDLDDPWRGQTVFSRQIEIMQKR